MTHIIQVYLAMEVEADTSVEAHSALLMDLVDLLDSEGFTHQTLAIGVIQPSTPSPESEKLYA